ncbi:MAG: nucleotidyltransferase family protein [Firmicutes bacterium]|nr:nucleotidyltransferase family protein [Bacillota bacterium]MCL1954151.1 nucleotidyltransferase family protein [Bacillota bacterium]
MKHYFNIHNPILDNALLQNSILHKKSKTACAVVCEYDPFHTGHKYMLTEAKLKSGCDYIVCIMSGSITQRATLPIVDKYTRARHALNNGADLVVQLPVVFSSANAQVFAQGAIKILNQLKFVTHLAFGIEKENTLDIHKVAHLLDNSQFGEVIAKASKYGIPYPSALQYAMQEYYPNIVTTKDKLHPNTILAIEYVRAIKHYNINIETVPIERTNNFNSMLLEEPYSSASSIRNSIKNGDIQNLKDYLPYNVEELDIKVNNSIYEAILVAYLKNTPISRLKKVHSISEGLEYRLLSVAKKYSDLDKIIKFSKSKRYIYSRIKRAVVQNYLQITKEIVRKSTSKNTPIPFRVLGIRTGSTHLLGFLPNTAIVQNTDIFDKSISTLNIYFVDQVMDVFKELINRDIVADNLYCVCSGLDKDMYFGSKLIKV